MKKLKLLLAFTFLLGAWQGNAQTGLNCSNAVPITQPFSQTYSSGMGEFWFKTTPTNASLSLSVTQHYNQINVKRIELYAGNCSSLALVTADSLSSPTDSVKSISTTEIKAGATYYIRVVFIDKSQKYDYILALMPPGGSDPYLFVTNTNSGQSCGIDDEEVNPADPYCFVTACVGDPLFINYGLYNASTGGPIIDLAIYLSGTLVYTGTSNSTYNFTPTVPGNYLVIQTTLPLPPSGYYTGINVIVGGPNTIPSPIINPASGPYCLGECIVFTPQSNVFNASFSTIYPATPCYAGGTPPQAIANSFIFTNPGINTVNYTINGGSTCEQTFPIPINILTPIITISATIPVPCTFDRVLTANLSCIPSGTSPTYNWTIYNGTSNTGAVVYSSSFASNILNYTFPTSGTYYVEVQSSTGFTGGQIITITPIITPIINITSTALSLCDVPKIIKGQAFITLDPNVTMGTGDVATWTATDANTFATLSIPYYIGANGVINYNMFAFTSYPNPINFCVDLTVNGCENKQCFTLFPCCPKIAGTIVYSNTIFTTNTTLTNVNAYRFSGVITINPGVHLYIKYADVSFDPNTKINILSAGILSTNHSYLHGCSAMWDGIYLYNNSQLDIDETTIEDAKRAVVDTLGANDININYSWFNKNYESVIFKYPNTTSGLEIDHNYFTDDHIPTAYTTAPIYILASSPAPATVGAYSRAHLLPPYNGVTIKPYSGITLIQTKTPANTNQYVIIGDNNIFDKLHYGIIATRSKLWVRKNSFFNMDGRGDVGVLIAGAATGLQNVVNPSDVKIGGTVAEANDFNTCYNGVISNYATALTVRNNNFIFSNTAIAVNANNRNKTATVDRNKINATQLGIQFYNNISLNSQITENTLINTIPVGIYNSNTGINVSEVVTTSYTKYNLYNNNINGYFNGIYVTNTYSTQITDNEVHLTPDNTPYHFQFGIRIENTNLAFLYNNNVDKPSADNNAWWQYGIFANTNITPRLLCNGVNNMYASLKFQGPNITTAGFGIIGNDMNNGKIGIWLDAQAEIGNQYLSIFGNYASDNKWHGFSPTNPQTFSSSGSNALNATMDTKGIMPTGNVYYLDPANATGVLTGSSHYLLRNPFSFPSQNLNCNSGIATPLLRMQNANNIASNTIGFAGNAANMYAISKRHLFHNIKLNNINVSTDPIIKAFMDSANATHIGKFYQVDSMMLKAIATGSTSLLNTARNLNNSIANTGNIVYNKQTLNTTYMNMLNAEPDSATLADLRTLAIKCPNLEGDAVFQARGILMYYDRVTYTSICDNTVPLFGTNHRLGNTDNALAPQEPKELIVYPNPTNRDITIEYTKGDDNEAAELVVFNQLGELVLTKTLSDNKTTLSLEFLNSGIYFYTIRQQGMVLKTSKLVITK